MTTRASAADRPSLKQRAAAQGLDGLTLLVLPAVLSLSDNGVRYVIAAGAVVILLGAVLFSKRAGSTTAGVDPVETKAAEPVPV